MQRTLLQKLLFPKERSPNFQRSFQNNYLLYHAKSHNAPLTPIKKDVFAAPLLQEYKRPAPFGVGSLSMASVGVSPLSAEVSVGLNVASVLGAPASSDEVVGEADILGVSALESADGTLVDWSVGVFVGSLVGSFDGTEDGELDGESVGGDVDGSVDGDIDVDGLNEGAVDGDVETLG